VKLPVLVALAAALAACGGSGTAAYHIGGALSGLSADKSVTLQNESSDNTTLSSNGSFNFATPISRGSPYSVTILTQPAGELCSVANGSGVGTANVSNIAVSCAPSYAVNAVVTGLANVTGLVLENNADDDLAVSVSGSTPFKTPLVSGATYNVTISAQLPGHTCTVSNPTGTVANSSVTVTVICPWHVGYSTTGAAPEAQQGVLAYYLDQSTGTTSPLPGNPFAAGTNPTGIAVDPAAQYLYVANQGDNTLSAFHISPTDGSLSPIAGSPFAVGGTAPVAVAIDAQGKFVYVGNAGSSDISAFSIDSSTGSLTAVAGSPFAIGADTQSNSYLYLAVSGGGFVYLGYSFYGPGAYIAGFSMNPATGGLSPIAGSPFFIDGNVGAPFFQCGATVDLIDPKARFFYAGFDCPNGTDTGYFVTESIDPVNGALTTTNPTAPFYPSPIIGSLAADSTGSFLYNGDNGADYIDVFQGPSADTRYEVGGAPTLTGIDPSNRFLYAPAINENGQKVNLNSPYSIDPTTGALTPFMSGTNTTINNAGPVVFSTTP
jgi:DNA-binding beta-propeller fold protein YncE